MLDAGELQVLSMFLMMDNNSGIYIVTLYPTLYHLAEHPNKNIFIIP